jgi:glycosyltransferase involved in cell wall biosynthesis
MHDGGALANFNMLKGLVDAGVSVKLLALNPSKELPAGLPEVFDRAGLEYVNVDTSISPLDAFLNLFSSEPYNLQRFRSDAFQHLIKKNLSEQDFDLVHFEGIQAATYLPAIKSEFAVPCVFRQHNVEHMIWERMAAGASNPFRKIYLSLLARRVRRKEIALLKIADGVVAIAPGDAAFFEKIVGKNKVIDGGQGFDLDRYKQPVENVMPGTLVHLGSMDWLPNLEAVDWLLDEIWPALIESDPSLCLYIAGKSMPGSFLDRSCDSCVISREVPDAVKYIADKEIMLVPLKSGSGIRIKTIEGMAAGKVVVSTSLGAEGLGATRGKEIMIADSVEEFVAAVKQLRENRSLYLEIAENARKFVRDKYSNDMVSRRMIGFYSTLLKKQTA